MTLLSQGPGPRYGRGFTLGAVDAPFRLVVGDRIGLPECPYLRRWYVQTPLGTVRVHCFLRSDDDRACHDHPWSFVSFGLRGSYDDLVPCPDCGGSGETAQLAEGWERAFGCERCERTGVIIGDRMSAGRLRFRPAYHRHRIRLTSPSAWTLVVSGPKRRTWGFWQGHLFTPWRKFMALNGAPACVDVPAAERNSA